MKIESIIRREAGTTVVLGTQTYAFKAGEDGRHACDVEDEAHIERLLSIKEGFREVDEKPASTKQPAKEPAKEPAKKVEGEVKPKGGRKPKAATAEKASDISKEPGKKVEGEE